MTSPLSPFLGVLVLLCVAVALGGIILVASGVLLPRIKPNNPQPEKLTPFECGAPLLQGNARHRYSVKFYLTAMLFILFDVEAAFLLPWAVQYKQNLASFWIMVAFFGTLLIGFIYAWGKGAFEWEK
jgi:NADH-quinone oxidoreductase subunit A